MYEKPSLRSLSRPSRKKVYSFPKNVWPVSVQAAANNDECSSSSSSMTHQHGCCRMVLKKCRIGCLTRCRVSSQQGLLHTLRWQRTDNDDDDVHFDDGAWSSSVEKGMGGTTTQKCAQS